MKICKKASKQNWELEYKIGILSAVVILAILMIYTIEQKSGFDVDEVFSYGLANNTYGNSTEIQPTDGMTYTPGELAFSAYMTVQKGESFSYKNVWKNQKEDVHPPLYYVVLHTLCSFFPERMSKWFAGSINICFAILTMLVSVYLVRALTNSKWFSLVFAYYFAFAGGMIEAGVFFRMYVMAMFWVTLLTFLFLKALYAEQKRKVFVLLYLSSVLGALTHYYVVVYLFFISVTFGVILFMQKKWKDIIQFCITMALAGISTAVIFPAIFLHLFVSDRGKQSFENAGSDLQEYLENLKGYFSLLSQNVFSGLLVLCVLVIAVGCVFACMKKEKRNNSRVLSYVLIGIPCMGYFLLVAKIAVYTASRYLHPIYACVAVVVAGLLYCSLRAILSNKKLVKVVCVLWVIMLSAQGFYLHVVSYAKVENERQAVIDEYFAGKDCIYLYYAGEMWKIQSAYAQLHTCSSILFAKDSDFDAILQSSIKEKEEFVVVISDSLDEEFLLQSMLTIAPKVDTYEKIEISQNDSCYYFHG